MDSKLVRSAVGVLIFVVAVVVGWQVADRDDAAETTSGASDVVRVGKGERRVSIVLPGELEDDASVAAQLKGKAPRNLSVTAETKGEDTIRVVLSKRAPSAVRVSWTVDGLTSTDEAATAADDLVPAGILSALGVLVLVGAYLLTHVSATGSVLFAAFARVTGLLLISGLGLFGAILASRADNAEAFTALFTLLGLVAGYLAGTKTEPQTGGGGTAGPGGPGGTPPTPGDNAPESDLAPYVSRSLL